MADIILNQTRGGTLSAPFVALTVETLTFSGTAPEDGTTVALLSSSGDTLASTHVAGGQATINLNTIQADAATRYTEVGTTIPVVLAIGDTDHLQALIQTTLQRNPLDNIAPPTVSAPIYPTNAELKAVLARIDAVLQAANQTAEAITQDAQRVDNLVNVELQKAVEEIDSHLDERVRAAETTIERAATDASTSLSDAAESASTALDGKVSTASTALDNKLTTAQTALDGKVKQAEDAATAADGSAKSADKSRQDAEAAKGNAAESASNAATSAEQAEQAKDSIGDVGGRLDAVETSVTGKQPYISQLMLSLFDYKRYDFAVGAAAMFVRAPCHEGFIYYAQYQNAKTRYFGVNGQIIPFPVRVDDCRITIIGDNETVVFAQYNGLYKFTISGRGDAVTITHEELDAFPANIGSYAERIIGWRTRNGYIVTSNGLILDGTTFAEISTFAYNGNWEPVVKGQILKIDDTFYYKDATTHQFVTMTIGDDGVPSLSVNGYKQNTGISFYPIAKDTFVAVWHSRVVGITSSNGYLYDNTGGDDTFLGVATFGPRRFIFTWNDAFLVYGGNTQSGGYSRLRVASNLTMMDNWSANKITSDRVRIGFVQDNSGNVFVVNLLWYEDTREFVHVFKKR